MPNRTVDKALRSGGAALVAGTLVGNAASYGFFALLSRMISPADIGAVGALMNLANVMAVVGLGAQLVAARVATEMGGSPSTEDTNRLSPGRAVRAGLVAGGICAGALALASPLLAHVMRLDNVLPVLAVALACVPMTLCYAWTGVLQGRGAFARVGLVLAMIGVTRCLAGLVGGLADADAGGVMAWVLVAWSASALIAWGLLDAAERRQEGVRAGSMSLADVREVARAASPMAGLFVLSSVDVVLARYFLASDQSGEYALAALFAKVAMWGPAFVATFYYPRMARPAERRQAVVRALGTTAVIGVAGTALAAALARPLAIVVGGTTITHLAGSLWLFVVAGVILALLQVLVYADLAVAGRAVAPLVFAGAFLTTGLVWLRHDGVLEVLISALAAFTLTGFGAALTLLRRERRTRAVSAVGVSARPRSGARSRS